MIRRMFGDLFTSTAPALAQGCNCRGVMGAGIAKQFRDKWPAMYGAYQARCESRRFTPGDVMLWEPPRTGQPYIFNLATQLDTGADARMWAIAASVGRMVQLATSGYGFKQIAMPAIGTGIGGLTKGDLYKALAPYDDAPVDLLVYELEGDQG